MASKHITKAEITFSNLTLQQLPQNTKTYQRRTQAPALQHHRQLSSSLARFLCNRSVILYRSNLRVPSSTYDHAAQRWRILSLMCDHLCVFFSPSFILASAFAATFHGCSTEVHMHAKQTHLLPSPQPYLTTNMVFTLLHNLLSTFPGFPCVLIICLL